MYSTPAVGPEVQNTRRSCGAERFPVKPRTRGSPGPAPKETQGAGRESNLLSHVLHSGSRMLFSKFRRRISQTTCVAIPPQRRACEGGAGGTRTHNPISEM